MKHPMRKTTMFFAGVALLLIVHSIARAHDLDFTPTVACRTVDRFADGVRSYVMDVTSGADSISGSLRIAFNLPQITDTTQISFVSDSTACTRAAKAHALAEQGDTLNPPPVYLLGVGPARFVAFNGARAGEFLVHYVLDQNFNVLESF